MYKELEKKRSERRISTWTPSLPKELSYSIAIIYHIFCDANLPINIIVSFISIPCHNHNNKTMRDFLMCHQWDFAVSILFIGECSQIWRYIIRGVTRFAIFVPNPPLQDAEFDWANFTRPAYQKPCDTFWTLRKYFTVTAVAFVISTWIKLQNVPEVFHQSLYLPMNTLSLHHVQSWSTPSMATE